MMFNIRNLVIGLTVVLPVFASAQEDGAPITREQVRAELVDLENAGYRLGKTSPYYPADIQAAEAKIHAGKAVGGNPQTSYGGVTSVNSESADQGGGTP
ncbi:MAG: DUF4148 domain-containing protein [Paraburkholderia sp.]|uniref:DUF4148 domain-containing protein n=1 Tax=Paraburkholderia sp. TaxID=1926495 RepID=UPI00397C2F7A